MPLYLIIFKILNIIVTIINVLKVSQPLAHFTGCLSLAPAGDCQSHRSHPGRETEQSGRTTATTHTRSYKPFLFSLVIHTQPDTSKPFLLEEKRTLWHFYQSSRLIPQQERTYELKSDSMTSLCYPYGSGITCVCDEPGRIYKCFPDIKQDNHKAGSGGGSLGGVMVGANTQLDSLHRKLGLDPDTFDRRYDIQF